MQKLEEILRAEEAARHTVASAKERATALVREAEAASKAIAEQTRADVAADAESLRHKEVAAAQKQASTLEAESADALESQLTAARQRIPQAVNAAISALSE